MPRFGPAAAVLAAAVLLCVVVSAARGSARPAIRDYLEGTWLVGERPNQGSCLSHTYHGNELEFEFEKSGGRLLYFEPPDLFTAIAIPQIDEHGDEVLITARTRKGDLAPSMRLRLAGPDRLELLPPKGGGEGKSEVAYKCDAPDRSVTGSVSAQSVALLTPNLSGGQGFVEIRPVESKEEVCRDSSKDGSRRWLQFELLGPDHYWLFGWGDSPDHSIAFDLVRSVRQRDPRTLTLNMQRRPDDVESWRPQAVDGKNYSLTIIDKGDRIGIPELSADFVRCNPDEPASLGMHRW